MVNPKHTSPMITGSSLHTELYCLDLNDSWSLVEGDGICDKLAQLDIIKKWKSQAWTTPHQASIMKSKSMLPHKRKTKSTIDVSLNGAIAFQGIIKKSYVKNLGYSNTFSLLLAKVGP